jgi:hypothetical protein
VHGIFVNAIYVWQDKFGPSDFLSHSTAMIVGDFIGCFIVIVFFNICIDIAFILMNSERQKEGKGIRSIAHFLNQSQP